MDEGTSSHVASSRWTRVDACYNQGIRDGMSGHLHSESHLMSLYEILIERWDGDEIGAPERERLDALEQGRVLFLPRLRFAIQPGEAGLFTPAILDGAKN